MNPGIEIHILMSEATDKEREFVERVTKRGQRTFRLMGAEYHVSKWTTDSGHNKPHEVTICADRMVVKKLG